MPRTKKVVESLNEKAKRTTTKKKTESKYTKLKTTKKTITKISSSKATYKVIKKINISKPTVSKKNTKAKKEEYFRILWFTLSL
mgnify:CR=1 FL=1